MCVSPTACRSSLKSRGRADLTPKQHAHGQRRLRLGQGSGDDLLGAVAEGEEEGTRGFA